MSKEEQKIMLISNINQNFNKPDGSVQKVLEDINFHIATNEIVGLLGKSGSGKSTILRIISGLIQASSGDITYHEQKLTHPDEKIAMVFQNFALFPWLTVLENVELGLEAKKMPIKQRREKALAAINLIGLDGYEHSYPKEISGGMRQRVGLARALVVEPEILLMDEPFSALDVLTGEILKTDLLDLWMEEATSLKSILLVTHNIEEAVFLCNRILVLSSNPGKIIEEVPITIPHPRDRLSKEFREVMDHIYDIMTHKLQANSMPEGKTLPNVHPIQMEGLLNTLHSTPYDGQADLAHLAYTLTLTIDRMFPLLEALRLLQFVEVADGNCHISAAGRLYLAGNTRERKEIFGQHLIQYLPLASHIRRALGESRNHVLPYKLFLSELMEKQGRDDANQTLTAVIHWCRYGELFYYNNFTKMLSLGDGSK